MSFDGNLLKRGFWIYIWKIVAGNKTVYYVGRNGDSSSCNAASPFSRIGQHLNFKDNAKGNSLGRRLDECGISPEKCTFEMVAIGPLYAEQSEMAEHKICRDKTAALEKAVADYLRERGKEVLGIHESRKPLDEKLFSVVKARIDQSLL
jgi:hypothetical protein